MDDSQIEALIDNERDWRKYLVKKMDAMQREHMKFHQEIAAMRVWNRITRIGAGTILGLLIYWVKGKLSP